MIPVKDNLIPIWLYIKMLWNMKKNSPSCLDILWELTQTYRKFKCFNSRKRKQLTLVSKPARTKKNNYERHMNENNNGFYFV